MRQDIRTAQTPLHWTARDGDTLAEAAKLLLDIRRGCQRERQVTVGRLCIHSNGRNAAKTAKVLILPNGAEVESGKIESGNPTT